MLEESEKQYFQEVQLSQALKESLKMQEEITNADIKETLKFTSDEHSNQIEEKLL
jgi:hypothetical protein